MRYVRRTDNGNNNRFLLEQPGKCNLSMGYPSFFRYFHESFDDFPVWPGCCREQIFADFIYFRTSS